MNSKDDNPRRGWLKKLQVGLKKSSLALTDSLEELLVRRAIDTQTLEEIEDLLIAADLGVEAASKIP